MTAQRLVRIVRDYRRDQLEEIDEDHVTAWANQFPAEGRSALLDELCHVFSRTYVSKEKCQQTLARIASATVLVGENPQDFWRHTHLLNIQHEGRSQRELLPLFTAELQRLYGATARTGSHLESRFVYLDDGLFSAARAQTDLVHWIRTGAPNRCELHCIFFVVHTLGKYFLQRAVERAAREAGKRIELRIWHGLKLENRLAQRNSSDVLWPISIPGDSEAEAYALTLRERPFVPRVASNYRSEIYSSEDRRRLLEEYFVVAGAKIVASCAAPRSVMRPLGFSTFGLGFGSLFVSYRNCPNNAPLSLWWNVDTAYARSRWRPLFKRIGYGNGV